MNHEPAAACRFRLHQLFSNSSQRLFRAIGLERPPDARIQLIEPSCQALENPQDLTGRGFDNKFAACYAVAVEANAGTMRPGRNESLGSLRGERLRRSRRKAKRRSMGKAEIVPKFQVGDRICLRGNWEFPDGTKGTVIEPPAWAIEISETGAWRGHFKLVRFRKGQVPCYVVRFDEPTDDGTGDGPYRQAVIDEESMVRMGDSAGFD